MKKQITGAIIALAFILTLGFGPFGNVGMIQNSWTTNRPPTAVQGVDNLSVSNLPQSKVWNFFGDTSNTVARLHDIGQSNGNYVLKYNGVSDGQTATNLTAYGLTSPSGIVFDGTHSLDYDGLGTLDGANMSMGLDGSLVVNGSTTTGTLLAGTDIAALGSGVIGTTLRVVGPITNTALSPSKLVATGPGTNLTSSAYSDQTIADLQTATNAFIRTNAGTGYFTLLYSPTNTAQASNQVVQTIQGLAGQTNDLARFQSNGTTVVAIKPSGAIGIGISAPTNMLDVIGNAHVSGTLFFDGANPPISSSGILRLNSGTQVSFQVAGTTYAVANTTTLGPNADNSLFLGGPTQRFKEMYGVGFVLTNSNVGIGTATPTRGKLDIAGTLYAPTNTAPFFTTNFSTLLVTNLALPQRALLFVQLAFDDVTGGIPSCTVIATNTVSTNNFGSISPTLNGLTLVGTQTITNHYTYVLDTNQVIKITDTSTGGASTRMVQSILFGL